MSTTSTITPTSSLTPLDLLPLSGPVDYYKDQPYAIDEHQNFKRLGSFWTRQMSHDGKKHAKALSLTGICTNSLMDVQNVKNNLANDRDNLYFNNINLPLEGVLAVAIQGDIKADPMDETFSPDTLSELLHELIANPETVKTSLITRTSTQYRPIFKFDSNTTKTIYIWKLSTDIELVSCKIYSDNNYIYRGKDFVQFGRWVLPLRVTKHSISTLVRQYPYQIFRINPLTESLRYQPLCSGYYSSNSYFGQSFYKPLLNLEYLPVGPGAKFVADYISGKHQNPQALEVFLNTIVGLESNIGRPAAQVISLNNYDSTEISPEEPHINKRWLVLQDKITRGETKEKYNLVYYGDKDTSITAGMILPPNSFAKYLVQIAIKQEPKGETFNRVTPYNSSAITIDRLQASSVFPTQDNIMYKKGVELNKLIVTLDSTMIVHLGYLYDWYKYHEYMSNRSDYFKSHFKTYKDLINYIIRTVREYAPITYKPLFTCTWVAECTSDASNFKTLTSDYQLFLTNETQSKLDPTEAAGAVNEGDIMIFDQYYDNN